ncbi:hypothetical protein EC9_07730 [Rosistilla ulvae]|uniref:Uncharacterized protein n=1 Tax=Rosistilla ulvae TaxID=1930277 RepID=A0A517LVF4_9BACT|nr:hypothetical protein EC9_07730 [Rosistilla ulvae]
MGRLAFALGGRWEIPQGGGAMLNAARKAWHASSKCNCFIPDRTVHRYYCVGGRNLRVNLD